MKTRLRPAPLFFLLFAVALFLPATVFAQATKIFVASFGNDANDGSRGSPKRNFQAAHNAVDTDGQIVVLDTAGYGALTITKSIAITVPPGVNGFVTVTGTSNAITINATSSSVVSLRGLIIEGVAAGFSTAIRANTVGNLSIEDCTLRNFQEGILFIPTNNANLYIYNTTLRRCGFGIDVEVAGSFTAIATVNGCRIEQSNSVALEAFTPSSTNSSVDVSVADCVITGSAVGISADKNGTGPVVVRVNNCNITGNAIGITGSGGGQVQSRSNNTLEKNASGNAFTGSYPER